MTIQEAIERVVNLENLKEEEMRGVMEEIMSGDATPSQIAAFITGLRIKGETVEEIAGAAKVMREKAVRPPIFESSDSNGLMMDIVGTGGDGVGTFNISTTTAFVVAAGGVRVAKHGNRSVSSRCGSADLLERLGINIDATPEAVANHIKMTGIGFLFAPRFHTSMRYALQPRKEIGIRTVFNLLGPLTNPAFVRYILAGSYKSELCKVFPHVLRRLGTKRAMVVHSLDGLDEISPSSETEVGELIDNQIKSYTVRPEDFGFKRCNIEELKGRDAESNVGILKGILTGRDKGSKRVAVLMNAGASFYVAGKVSSIKEGIDYASLVIDSGMAMKKLEDFLKVAGR